MTLGCKGPRYQTSPFQWYVHSDEKRRANVHDDKLYDLLLFFFTCNWCIFVNILNCKLLGSLHVGLYAFGWRFKLSCGQRLTTLQSHFRLPVLIYISIAYHTVCFEGQSESLNRDERQLSVSRRTTLARALFAAAKPELNIFFLSALPIDKFSWLWCHSTLVLSFSLNSSCFMSKSTSSFLA